MNSFYEILNPDGSHHCFIAVLLRNELDDLAEAGYEVRKHQFARTLEVPR